ncbi:hypothetical protein BGX33_002180, partial [Mortierella sp. NVP41]
MNALRDQGDGLETLELIIRNANYMGVHEKMATILEKTKKVLERCRRLERFSMYNYSKKNRVRYPSILLEGLRTSQELESLVLVGLPFTEEYGFSNDDCGVESEVEDEAGEAQKGVEGGEKE